MGERLLPRPQVAAEAAHVARVEPPEGAHQESLGPARVDVLDVVAVIVVEVEHGAQGVQHRQHSGVAHEGHVVGGDLDRDARTSECPAQAGDGVASRPHQHGHVGPLDAVLEVGAPEQVGEVLGLGALGLVRRDLDPAVPEGTRLGNRGEERVASGCVDRSGEGQPACDPLRRRQQAWAEPSRRPESEHVGRRAVGPGEVAREVEDAADLGPTEGVDRLVRVTDDREVAAVAGELPEQLDLGRVGVLVLVHEDVRELRPQLVAVHRRLDHGPPDQVGVVGRALLVEVE